MKKLNHGLKIIKPQQKVKFPDCWICKDHGIIFFDTKIDGILYECVVRCKCKYGQKVSEKVPTVRDDYAEQFAEANFNNFKEIYPDLIFDLVEKSR